MKTLLLLITLSVLPIAISAQDVARSQREAAAKYPDISHVGSPLHTKFIALYKDAKEYNPALLSTPNWPMILADRAAGANVISPRQRPPSSKELAELRAKADKGDAKAQYYFGLMYSGFIIAGLENETSSAKVNAEARKWYIKAAEQGLAEAQFQLGRIADDHTEEAAKWYRKAADQGLAEAQYSLGLLYGRVGSLLEDQEEATKWYRKAAEQGHVHAQNYVSHRYRRGQGVPKDEAEAYKWMLLAAAQGDSDAKEWIKQLDERLTSAQRTEGQRRAREFKPK